MGGVIQALGATLKKSKHMKVGFRQPSLKKEFLLGPRFLELSGIHLALKPPKDMAGLQIPRKQHITKFIIRPQKDVWF